MPKINRAGAVYGRLTVLREGEPSIQKSGKVLSTWVCKCSCGKEVTLITSYFTSGDTKSCGCLRASTLSSGKWKGCGELSGSYWYSVRQKAETRNLKVDISIEYAYALFKAQAGVCALSGMPISFAERLSSDRGTASLDRIDSTKGYVEGNVQWLHKDVNIMKNAFTEDRFLEVCKAIIKYRNL